MRKLIFVLLSLFCVLPAVKAQYPTDSAEVYLITASPGEQTYAIFGHSALRVFDKMQMYDVVFNYGTFDFSTENFYWKFGTGKLMYYLSISDYTTFLENYFQNGQAIYLQELNLTNKDKNNLLNNLQVNYSGNNKFFRYDFFRDNCATRIRDIVAKSIEGKVTFDSTYVTQRESFRRLFGDYLKNQPWTFFGLNLLMGRSTDSIASISDYMYLPGHLQNLFTTAKVITPEGNRQLTKAPEQLFPSQIVVKKPSVFTSPVFVCMLIFLAVMAFTIWEYRTKRYFKSVDVFFFLVTGILGLVITWLWGFSLHIYVHNNLHIVWASPLNFIAGLLLVVIPHKKWLRYYFAFYALSVLLIIPVSFFIMQEIPAASYFLMGMMIVRAVRVFMLK